MPRFITHPRRSASQQVTIAPAAPVAPTREQTLQSLRRIYTTLQRGQIESAKIQLTALGQSLSLP